MKSAGQREKQIAENNSQYCTDGTPWITVYVDGSWSKRSYGTNFNALSGMVAIIGKNTNSILFLAVRNKFCCICTHAEKLNKEPKPHICYKNWNSSASAMEPNMLVEGFNVSELMHGIRYCKFVGDGDSSVYCNIINKVSYGREVKKLECTNHALKNYGKRLRGIKTDKQINIGARKLLTINKIKHLTKRAKTSIYSHSNKHNRNIELLKVDLRIGIDHVFGDHSGCRPEICNIVGNMTNNQIPELKSTTLYSHLNGKI